MIRTNLLWILTIILLTSCSNRIGQKAKVEPVKEAEETLDFDYGRLNDGVYENTFFDIKIPYDKTWVVQDNAQMDHLSKVGKDLITGDNEALKSIIKASEVNSANLFGVFEHEYGAAVDFNPSFLVVAENTSFMPGIKRGKDYLFHAKKLLMQTKINYEFGKEVIEKKIDNVAFDVMEVTGDFGHVTVRQEYYSTVKKGFCLSFIITFNTEEQKAELYSILNGIDFTK